MHKKYGDQGLVAVSVSTDTQDAHENAVNRLTQLKITLPSYRLADDSYDTWSKVWQYQGGAPLVFVFDSSGRRAAKFNGLEKEFTAEEVENVVKKLVAEKHGG